jgi:hypothetical protein
MFSFLDKTKNNLKKTFSSQSQGTDKFADKISIQLKSVAASAVLKALNENEGRFLSSILKRSYFQLDSLTITPEDQQTSMDLEEFLRVHEAIDPAFRKFFFSQMLQPEYRSESGARARVNPEFSPSFQFSAESIAELTAEEKFQVSLRGEKILFKAQAVLSGPFSIESTSSSAQEAKTTLPRVTGSTLFLPSKIPVIIDDTSGRRSDEIAENCIVGRIHDNNQRGFLAIHGTYVSRRHLILAVFDTDVYLSLHEDASLSALLDNNVLLEEGRIYRLERTRHHKIILGLPKNGASNRQKYQSNRDFPTLELGISVELSTIGEHTPVPKLK